VDVASLFAFVSAAPPQGDGSSGLRGNCPPACDQFGSALELALQGDNQAAAAWRAGLPDLREPGTGVLPTLAFLQAAGDGGAVPNLAGDVVSTDEDPAKDLTKDLTKDASKSLSKDVPEDVPQGLTRDPAEDVDASALAMLTVPADPAGIERERFEPQPRVSSGVQTAWTEGSDASAQRPTVSEPTITKTGGAPDRPAPTGREYAVPAGQMAPPAPETAAAPASVATDRSAVVRGTHTQLSPNALPQAGSTRPGKLETGALASHVNPGPAPDGGFTSDVVPSMAVSPGGVPAGEGLSAPTRLPEELPARTPDMAKHHPLNTDSLRTTADAALQALPAPASGQPPGTIHGGWPAAEGAPAQATGAPEYTAPAPFVRSDPPSLETSAAPPPGGPTGTVLPAFPRAWPAVEGVATPGPATTQPGAQANAQSGAQPGAPTVLPAPLGAGEALHTSGIVVPRQDDAVPLTRQADLPELIEGRASKAYLRSQAGIEAQAPGPDPTARTKGAAEPHTAGDGQPERDARHNHAARQPFVSATFVESLASDGGLGQVFSIRTPGAPVGDSTPAPPEPTSGGEPLDQAIVKSLKLQWNQGAGEAKLRLQPEFLGDLSVSLRVIGASVTAVLRSDSPAVREWIQAHQGDLRRALEEAGLSLDRLVVDEDGDPQEQQGHPAQDGRRQPNRQKPEAGRFEALL
jgi:hypothetical protein